MRPNAWGLNDTKGNVRQWTSSNYAKYPNADAEVNPNPPPGKTLENQGVSVCVLGLRYLSVPISLQIGKPRRISEQRFRIPRRS